MKWERMIRAMHRYFSTIPPVFIDGLLYVLIAVFGVSQSYFGGDEAAKYIPPTTKFWLNGILGICAAAVGAMKMFRSTTYSEHQDKKKGDTQFISKPKDT